MTKTINLDEHIETVTQIVKLREERAIIKDKLETAEDLIHGILDLEDADAGTVWGETIFTVSNRKGRLSLDKKAIARDLGVADLSAYEKRGKAFRVHHVVKGAAETLALVGRLVASKALSDLR